MGRKPPPHVEVRVEPPVYDPARYNRGVAILARAYERAVLRRLEQMHRKEAP